MLPTRITRGRRTAGLGSAGSDNSHRCDLDRHRERKRVRAKGRPGVTAGFAKHILEQVGGPIHHLWLVAEPIGRQHKADHLRKLFDVVQAGGRVDLRQHVQRADPRARLRLINSHLVGTATGEPLAIFHRDLAGDVKQRATVTDWNQSRRNV